MSDLLVLLPVRHRRENAIRCAASFAETADDAEMLVISDADDGSYDGIEWPARVSTRVMGEWMPYVPKINTVAVELAPRYKALFAIGDDCMFETPGWDTIMMKTLADMGGTGIVYPENHRRNDVPEQWMTSTDIVQALGWFANPVLSHYYTDNTLADIGQAARCIKFCPDAVIRHHHYSVDPSASRDGIYTSMEELFGARDEAAYKAWRRDQMAADVATVRKVAGTEFVFTLKGRG